MTQQELVNEINKRLVPVYHPLEIYLYGKKEWGETEDSDDIEVTVVVKESPYKRRLDRVWLGYNALDTLQLGSFIFVLTKEEFDQNIDNQLSPAYFAKNHGIKIYEAV
ncbi:hypothetical protein FJ365_05640 [Candidatus Dependentiae bacterium]|nr:hypothetical protein [Candidatus Dependentiae bacterium]